MTESSTHTAQDTIPFTVDLHPLEKADRLPYVVLYGDGIGEPVVLRSVEQIDSLIAELEKSKSNFN